MNAKDHVAGATSQSDKFKEAARDLECDEDETRWAERLKKVAGQKPAGRQKDK